MATKNQSQIALPGRPGALNKDKVPPDERGKGKFNLAVSGNEAQIMLYGVIGWDDCAAENVVSAIKGINASAITVSINSPGGDVFDGAAIYNSLKQHPANIIVNIDGLAASAASVIAMAGDTVNIGKNAFMMIHNASGIVFGTGADLRQTADILDKIDGSIAQTYADATGKPAAEMAAMMKAETWMVGQEAVDAGFCDAVTGDDDDDDDHPLVSATAADLKAFAKVPSKLQQAVTAAGKHSITFNNQAGPDDATDQHHGHVAKPAEISAGAYYDQHPEIHDKWLDRETYVRSQGAADYVNHAAEAAHTEAGGKKNKPNHRPQNGDGAPRTRKAAEETSLPTSPHEITAEAEWDRNPQYHEAWIDKATFVNSRSRELIEADASAKAIAPVVESFTELEATWRNEWTANKDGCRSRYINLEIYLGMRRVEQRDYDRPRGIIR